MKNFETFEENSTAVAKNLEGFCQEVRKYLAEEANKEAVSDLFHLGLTSTVALHGHPGKREICTHVSVMYSCPFPSRLMTVLRRTHVRNVKL